MKIEDILMEDDFTICTYSDEISGNYICLCGVINYNKNFECYHTYVNCKNRFFDLIGEHIEDPVLDEYTEEELKFANDFVEMFGGKEKLIQLTMDHYAKLNKEYNDPEYTKELIELGKLKE